MPRLAILLVAVLCVAVLVLSGSPAAFGKKPAPPPPEPEPDPDPAIAYVTVDRKGNSELCVMNADGTNRTVIVDAGTAQIFRPEWSPDGEKIAFGSTLNDNTGVYVVNVDGTGLTRIVATTILPAPAWSPDVVPGVGDGVYRIAYNDRGPDGPNGVQNDIFIVGTSGEDKTKVVDTPAAMEGKTTWSPDGVKLVYSIADDTGDYFGVHDFITGTSTVRRLGGAIQGYRCHWPRWANDQSDTIAWQVTIGTDRDIFVVNLEDLDNPVRLTTGGNVERYPCWSPDDSEILFEVLDRKGNPSIAIMSSADGTGRTTLLSGGGAPAWKR